MTDARSPFLVKRFRLLALLGIFLIPKLATANQRALIIVSPGNEDPSITLLEQAMQQVIMITTELEPITPLSATDNLRIAQQQRAQANAHIQAGRRAFDNLNLEVAVKEFSRALQILEEVAASTGDVRDLPYVQSMLGGVAYLSGTERKAQGYLKNVFVLDPDFRPDATLFNPEVMAAYQAIRLRVQTQETRNIEITATPPGTAIFVDGALAGLNQVRLPSLITGKHYIRAARNGYTTQGRALEIEAPGTTIELGLQSGPKSPQASVMAQAAYDSTEGSNIPSIISEAASLSDASYVLIIRKTQTGYTLTTYDLVQHTKRKTSITAQITDAGTALDAARKLARGLPPPPEYKRRLDLRAVSIVTLPSSATNGLVTPSPSNPLTKEQAKPSTPEIPYYKQWFGPDETHAKLILGTYVAAGVFSLTGATLGILADRSEKTYLKQKSIDSTYSANQTTDQVEGDAVARNGKRMAIMADTAFALSIANAITALCLQLFWHSSNTATPTPRDVSAPHPLTINIDSTGAGADKQTLGITYKRHF